MNLRLLIKTTLILILLVSNTQAEPIDWRSLYFLSNSAPSQNTIKHKNKEWPEKITVFFDDDNKHKFCDLTAISTAKTNQLFYIANKFLTVGDMKQFINSSHQFKEEELFKKAFWDYYKQTLRLFVSDQILIDNYIKNDQSPFIPVGQSNVLLYESYAYRNTGLPLKVMSTSQFESYLTTFDDYVFSFKTLSYDMNDIELLLTQWSEHIPDTPPIKCGYQLTLSKDDKLALWQKERSRYAFISNKRLSVINNMIQNRARYIPLHDFCGTPTLIIPALNAEQDFEIKILLEKKPTIPHADHSVFEIPQQHGKILPCQANNQKTKQP